MPNLSVDPVLLQLLAAGVFHTHPQFFSLPKKGG